MPVKKKQEMNEGVARAIPVLDWEEASEATDPEALLMRIQNFEKQSRLWGIGRRTRKRPWPDDECLAGVVLPIEEADMIRAICSELIITHEEFMRVAIHTWMVKRRDVTGAAAFSLKLRTVNRAKAWLALNSGAEQNNSRS